MAEALVGGAFLSASLQVLFDRLAPREVLNLFGKRKTNVDGLLKKLKLKLATLTKLLDDADVKQFTDTFVRDWSVEARDAVYQADDLLSEIAYEARRRQVESDPNSQVNTTLISPSNFTSFDDYIEPKLGEILQLLEDLIQGADYLDLKEGVGRVYMPTNRSSSSVPVATDVYLRESEKEKLIERLLEVDETNKNVGVIPVVGMGGIGKTTLAQFAYHDNRVREHFDVKAWVCVSKVFDVPRVSKTILDSIPGSRCDFTDLNLVQERLMGELDGKKFLLVLDDVWNVNCGDWDKLRAPFGTGAPGSKIIVTTRIQRSADIMRNGGPDINLAGLSDEDCWPLFAEIAFGESSPSSYPPQLEEIGTKIVKRCGGLPLAVKSLAGLLRSKPLDVGEWEDVLKSEIWDLTEDECDILPALRLSYHHLPSHLKQCFAFCSIFPKDCHFREEDLVSLWIAQKFVLPRKGTSYEQEGKKCFRELLSMSFFQKSSYGESRFVMHDLIHDLAQAVSGQFAFKLDRKHQHDIPYKLRHFSYDLHSFRQLHAATEVTSLRTLLRHPGVGFDVEVLFRQKHLRVLSLPRYDDLADLELIGSLIHLQYLDLSRTKDMQQLPESICRLYNLETLILAGCSSLSSLPVEIGKLISLRRLDITWTNLDEMPESICRLYNLETLLLVGCSSLTNLPVEMGKLISLRRLDITGTSLKEMPIQMRLLEGLEYLSTFVVGKESGLAIGGLKAWNNLRGELEISGLENVKNKKDALEAKLVEKEALETLALGWGGVTNDSQHEREVLEDLRPHRNLKVLRIRNYGGTRFPKWLGDSEFTQMVSLRLEDCSYCACLPPLGQLTSLKELSVKGMGSVTDVGKEFFGGVNQPFPSLEALRFENMVEWVTWSLPGSGEFPKLRKLEIINCPMLVGDLPEVNIATLLIEGCSSLEASVPSSSPPYTDARKLELGWSEKVELNWLAMSDLVEVEISGLPSLQVLTSELSALTKLKTLKVAGCRKLLSLSNSGLPPMLTSLEIYKCELLQSVVDGMVSHNTCSLKWLDVSSCPLLASFADNGLPTTSKRIKFSMCPKLELSLSEGIEMCPSVEELQLYGCLSLQFLTLVKLFPNVRSLQTGFDDNLSILNIRGCPHGGGRLANLTELAIYRCKNLKALPQGMCDDLFPSLERIHLSRCPEIESLFEVSLLSKLWFLEIMECEKLMSFQSDWRLHTLPSLRQLTIFGGKNENVESFPNEGLLPSTLAALTISGFKNLNNLNPCRMGQLTSLQHLVINRCPQLESLPDEGLPPSLQYLWIRDCPLLRARCKKDSGDDWPKIAHIPTIRLDDVFVSLPLRES